MDTQPNKHAQETSLTTQVQNSNASQNEHANNQSKNTESSKSTVRNVGVRSRFVIVFLKF